MKTLKSILTSIRKAFLLALILLCVSASVFAQAPWAPNCSGFTYGGTCSSYYGVFSAVGSYGDYGPCQYGDGSFDCWGVSCFNSYNGYVWNCGCISNQTGDWNTVINGICGPLIGD